MSSSFRNPKASPSAKIKAGLDYPVIDTDVHVNDYAPVLEDYIQHYGGNALVDALRKALGGRFVTRTGGGKDWYQQTPEERQYHRTLRAPWWARVTRNTYDLATYTLPALLHERLGARRTCPGAARPRGHLSAVDAPRQAARRAQLDR